MAFFKQGGLTADEERRVTELVGAAGIVASSAIGSLIRVAEQHPRLEPLTDLFAHPDKRKVLQSTYAGAAVGLAWVRIPAENWSEALLEEVFHRIRQEVIDRYGEVAWEMALATMQPVSELFSGGEMPTALELNGLIGMMIWTAMSGRKLDEEELKLAHGVGGPVVEGFADWWITPR